MSDVSAQAVLRDIVPHAADAPIEEIAGGYSNTIWRVDAQPALALRRYGDTHVTRAAVRFEHVLMAHAARRLSEIAPPLADPKGETLTANAAGLWAVFPWIAGEAWRRGALAAEAAGTLLARFHLAVEDVHVASGMRTARILGTMAALRERFGALAVEPLLVRALPWNALLATLLGAGARIAVAGTLPVGIAHGDCGPGNVIFANDRAVGLIDFDFAHETERAYDVAIGIDEFGRLGEDEALDLEAAAAFVRGYESVLRLLPDERAVLPDLMIARHASIIRLIIARHGARKPGDVGGAPRYVERARETERRREEIRNALA